MKTRKLIAILIIIAIAAAVLLLLKTGKPKPPDNIILISLDTTRADRLSCYGYKHKTTPNIDAFAKEATLFENCFSNLPLTLPSHCSMFTGVIPPTHGVQDNLNMQLGDSVVTLTEILKEKGYSTYGIVSVTVLNEYFGLSQGFDVYDDQIGDGNNDSQDGLKFAERLGDETLSNATEWLKENKDNKKFMFVHFYDPHDPYEPPAPFDRQFQYPYDGEIAFTDDCVGKFLDELKTLGDYEDSLIIITGDHGEMLNEHNEPAHGYYIYHNSLHVPLIIKPAGKSKGRRVADNTTLIDIAPTILSQTQLEIPGGMQGMDLSGYVSGKQEKVADRRIFNESLYPTKYGGNTLVGIINDNWHYIQTTRPELYDISKDPAEMNNLIYSQPNRARILQDKLKQIIEETVITEQQDSAAMDSGIRKELESLGYVGGAVTADYSFDQTKPDPKELLGVHKKMLTVVKLEHEEKNEEVIKLCRQVLKENPNTPEAYHVMGRVYQKMEDYKNAVENLQKKLSLVPDDPVALKLILHAYVMLEDFSKAKDIIDTMLKQNPNDSTAHMGLASIHMKNKDHAKAIETIEKILEIDPENKEAYVRLAGVYIETNLNDKALKVIKDGLKLFPEEIELLKILSQINIETENYPAAIDTVNKILKLDPQSWEPYVKLSEIYIETKSYDKAIAMGQKALELKPDNAEALILLSRAYNKTGNIEQALKYAKDAVKADSENPEPYYQLAICYYNLNDKEKALANCIKAIELDPEHVKAHISAGEIYIQTDRLKEAIMHYEIALELDPDQPFQQNTVAWTKATSKDPSLYDPAKALIHAQKAVELALDTNSPAHPYYAHILDSLAAAQAANGQFEEAIVTAEKAIKLCRQRNLHDTAGQIEKHLELYKQNMAYRE